MFRSQLAKPPSKSKPPPWLPLRDREPPHSTDAAASRCVLRAFTELQPGTIPLYYCTIVLHKATRYSTVQYSTHDAHGNDVCFPYHECLVPPLGGASCLICCGRLSADERRGLGATALLRLVGLGKHGKRGAGRARRGSADPAARPRRRTSYRARIGEGRLGQLNCGGPSHLSTLGVWLIVLHTVLRLQ